MGTALGVLGLCRERLLPGRRSQEVHRSPPGQAGGGASSRTTVPSISPYGRSAAKKTSPGLSSPNGREVDQEVVLVRQRHPHLADSGHARPAPRGPSRTASAAATGCRSPRTRQQRLPGLRVGRRPVARSAAACRQRAVTAVARIRSVVSGSVVYRRARKPWNSESVMFSSTRSSSAGHDPGPGSPSSVTAAVRTLDALGAGSECVARAGPSRAPRSRTRAPVDRRLGVDEVPGEQQPELLGLADAVLAWRTRRRCSSGVSVGSTAALSPVRWVAARSPASATLTREVDQPVAGRRRGRTRTSRVSALPYRLGPSTIATSAPPVGRVAERAQQQRHVVVPAGLGDANATVTSGKKDRPRPAVSKISR